MYTRAEFSARRAKAAAIRKSLGGLTATVAVVLGLGQLAFIKLLGGRMVQAESMPVIGWKGGVGHREVRALRGRGG